MNFNRVKSIHDKNQTPVLPVKPGMFLEIHEIVGEGDARRIWKFKCLVIKVKNPNQPDGTFTVRGEVARMTIEKIYPLSFPNFDKVLLLDDYKIRRAKLYYIREKIGKDARFKSIISASNRNIDLLDSIKKTVANDASHENAEVAPQTSTVEPVNNAPEIADAEQTTVASETDK